MPVIPATGSARGFTLLEMLVVLAILVLTATAAPFAFNRVFPRQQLRIAAQDLAAELRSLREEAATENRATERSVGGKIVRFYPDGSSNGGRFELQAHGMTAFVQVSPLTGRIAVLP